ncbi:MarR family winged helix-turn-helix transcriptional regulator [Acerihabitans arboris]|uniref:MarR family transcriptional regulator n=1 Tax=Acerihabitans arboris TaxID=2691583 RepID=A0A845SDX2_9GAMM|nr:MarR family transcriptional regulator [Acerihabitans arboris]NDL61602.1 MarR family transcriptional regulator [Acerihabitans arboris]
MANQGSEPRQETAVSVDLGVLGKLLSFYIRSINITVSRDLDKKLAGLEVAKGTGKISTLLIVARHPGIRPSAIANAIMCDRSAMGRLVTKLESQGLLIRKISKDDSRSQELYLTPHGEELAAKVTLLVAEQEAEFFQSVSEYEKKFIIKVFKKVLNETGSFDGVE